LSFKIHASGLFGAAQTNLRYAEFCLTSQALMTAQEKNFAQTLPTESRKTPQ